MQNAKIIFLILSFIISASKTFCQSPDVLIRALNNQPVSSYLKNIENWRQGYKHRLTKKVSDLPDSVKNKLTNNADKYLDYQWPMLTASLYMDYKLTGDRNRFQSVQNARRKALNRLVIGAIITGDDKYIPQIVNGLWTMLEESTWVLPAHIVLQKAGSGLPDPEEGFIDLGAAITAPMIAFTQFMLYDQLQKYSPMVNKRIDVELRKRIYDPYLQRDDFWWMGFKGQSVNNWNAWCNTNTVHTALLNLRNADSLALLIDKAMRSTDVFVNQYPKDGGCDEGPTYWGEAGGKLIRLLHLLTSVSEGKLNWQGNDLRHNMGTYIYKMQIAGSNYVNFADALPKIIPNAESVYRFGDAFNDDTLRHFAAYLFELSRKKLPEDNVVDFLEMTDIFHELTTTRPTAPLPEFSYLPDLEVVTARSKSGVTDGLFLAVQGSNNGVSHNHNDVGNFIIYLSSG